MTISPQAPKLVDSKSSGLKILVEPHLTFVNVGFGFSLAILIREGLETDGASVPKEELVKSKVVKKLCKIISKHYPDKDYTETLAYLIGQPFDMPRLLAAIVHDALYGMKWKFRWLCDRVYRAILSENKYDRVRLWIEYYGIRLIGQKNWESVTDLERDRTRQLVDVKLVLTKNVLSVPNRIAAELSKKNIKII